jgi:hypothetical protein
MRTFNDSGPKQAAFRLGGLYDVARRIKRLGVSKIRVRPELLAVQFYDPRIAAEVTLTIEPWFDGQPGWFWYSHIDLPGGFIMGAMEVDRTILASPRACWVVRAYQEDARWQLGPLRIKRRS